MMMKQNKYTIVMILLCFIFIGLNDSFAQGGLGVSMPNASAQLNVDTFIAKNGKLTDLVLSTEDTDDSLVVGADGTIKKGIPSNITASQTGSVIVVNGKMELAQEMMLLMKEDFSTQASEPSTIGNITNVIIDNQNKFTSSSTSNSLSVSESGIYQIIMNCQINTKSGTVPVLGVWNNTKAKWIARVNDNFLGSDTGRQMYTLITAVEMNSSDVYSFRMLSSSALVKILALSGGTTGFGPVSYFSLKRVR